MMLFISKAKNFGFKRRTITWTYVTVYILAVEGRDEGIEYLFSFPVYARSDVNYPSQLGASQVLSPS